MEPGKKAIARLLDMPEESIRVDAYAYTSQYPNEITAWTEIGLS